MDTIRIAIPRIRRTTSEKIRHFLSDDFLNSFLLSEALE